MNPETFRAKVIAGINTELSRPWRGLITAQERQIAESAKTFFTSEVTAEQLAAMAARVTD